MRCDHGIGGFLGLAPLNSGRGIGTDKPIHGDELRPRRRRASPFSHEGREHEESMKLTDIAAPDYFHKVVDCQWACPAHTPVPEYIRLIAQGRYGDAYMINWKSNVFPGILGPHLRPPVRAGLPPRPRREGAGRDLPPEARRRRLQGRHRRAACRKAARADERQAHRAGRRRARLAHRRARSRAARLRRASCSTSDSTRRRHDAHADPEIPPAREGDRRGVRLHPRSRRRVPRRPARSTA